MSLERCAIFLVLILPVFAMAQSPSAASETVVGESTVAADLEPTDAAKLREELEISIGMARDGQFGRIKDRDMARVESAYAFMMETLSGVERLSDLNPQQQQSLALAQSQFDTILKPEDSERKICKRVASTGTRLGALECLTLAERRARAEASREIVKETQRGFCIPGEGNACGG